MEKSYRLFKTKLFSRGYHCIPIIFERSTNAYKIFKEDLTWTDSFSEEWKQELLTTYYMPLQDREYRFSKRNNIEMGYQNKSYESSICTSISAHNYKTIDKHKGVIILANLDTNDTLHLSTNTDKHTTYYAISKVNDRSLHYTTYYDNIQVVLDAFYRTKSP